MTKTLVLTGFSFSGIVLGFAFAGLALGVLTTRGVHVGQAAEPAPAPQSAPPAQGGRGQGQRGPAAPPAIMKDGLTYVWIPPGKFTMGCFKTDPTCRADEMPAHVVQITRGFWLGKIEVTQGAFKLVREEPPVPSGENMAHVDNVSWIDAANYCKAIGGRLPTEAEWEYAARAGDARGGYWVDCSTGPFRFCYWVITPSWQGFSSPNITGRMWSPPQQLPNDFGVLDGAMLEWVGDWYDKDYYKRTTAWVDPHGPETGSERVLRGEAWGGPGYVSLSIRNSRVPSSGYKDVGFRCAVESH